MSEHETEWEHKDKMWTYLIFLFVLVAIIVVVNLVWQNPTSAAEGVKHFLGLPAKVLATIMLAAGALIFWLGLKVEPDWPEAVGAFLIAGAAAWFEMIIGWKRLDFGGLIVVPYLIPLLLFVLLLMYAVRNSR